MPNQYIALYDSPGAWVVQCKHTGLPPRSEVSGSSPGPYVGKLVVAYQWSAVYSTEP